MREDLTDISIILDRSGSMVAVEEDTIGGFNRFIAGQRELPGACNVSLYQFDNEYEAVYVARPVADVPTLTKQTYEPRGATALLDAMGRTIYDTGTRLAAMLEETRPAKVLIVILTDGEENASREFSRERVFDLIRTQTDIYKWHFVYLGARQDAIQVGRRLGFDRYQTMTTAANASGTRAAYNSVHKFAAKVRGCAPGQRVSLDDEDRQWQASAGAGQDSQSGAAP